MQVVEDIRHAEQELLTTRKREKTFEAMLFAIGDIVRILASSDDEEYGEDKEDVEGGTELGKLSEDDEPGRVMGTISTMVQHCMASFCQKYIRLDKLM